MLWTGIHRIQPKKNGIKGTLTKKNTQNTNISLSNLS